MCWGQRWNSRERTDFTKSLKWDAERWSGMFDPPAPHQTSFFLSENHSVSCSRDALFIASFQSHVQSQPRRGTVRVCPPTSVLAELWDTGLKIYFIRARKQTGPAALQQHQPFVLKVNNELLEPAFPVAISQRNWDAGPSLVEKARGARSEEPCPPGNREVWMREPQYAWELGGKATMDQSLFAVGISQSWSSEPRWCDLTF